MVGKAAHHVAIFPALILRRKFIIAGCPVLSRRIARSTQRGEAIQPLLGVLIP